MIAVKMKKLFALLLNVVLIGAVSFYGDEFDGDTRILTLEDQARTQGPPPKLKPFDVDYISSDVGGGETPRGLFFHGGFPFFNTNFFTALGSLGTRFEREPWWKGPNVCTDKQESEDDDGGAKANIDNIEGAEDFGEIELHKPLSQFHIDMSSCVDKPNKHVCRKMNNRNGVKKTVTITHQCCSGYARPHNADFAAPCEKIDVKSIDETAAGLGAKEFIDAARRNGLSEIIESNNVTIFLPMDEAFKKYSEQILNENNLVETKADDKMMLRHMVPGQVSLFDVFNEHRLQTKASDEVIRMNVYHIPPTLHREPYRYTANCVPVEKHDNLSESGMVHTLRGVLKPVTMNVMDIIRYRSDMGMMRAVLEKTNLSEMLEGDKPYTVFAITDSTFEKLEPHIKRALKDGKGCATNILKNHILDLTLCSAACVVGAKTTAYNTLGEALHFNRSKDTDAIMINGVAKITESDIMGNNGVVHVIDDIIPTTAALPMLVLMKEKNITTFRRLLEKTGLDAQFDDMTNVTVLAPTDKALAGTKWAKLLEQDGADASLKDNEEVIEMIKGHYLSPMMKTCDLTATSMPTAAGTKVRVNLYATRATVNCARIVRSDDESCGSVLHQVDRVISSPKKNLLQILKADGGYSKFLELVHAANLTDLLADETQSLTLLVPKDDVFQEVREWEKRLSEDYNESKKLIKNHIINNALCCSGLASPSRPLRYIEALSGASLQVTHNFRTIIDKAGINKCDILATNGVLHEINDVIIPQQRYFRIPFLSDDVFF